MHKQRIGLIISAVVGIIAAFLPFIGIWHFTTSLFETKDGTGYLIIGSFVLCLILSLIGKQFFPLSKWQLIGAIIFGILPGVLLLLYAISRADDDLLKIFTNFKIGFYLTLIASISVIISAIALKGEEIETEDTEESDLLFCEKCGKKYATQDAGDFCDSCGAKLS